MKLEAVLAVVIPALIISATAAAQRNRKGETEAVERACGVQDCFFERDIREFEVIDQTHVIVYTGAQRCPFHVEVRGTLCDLTFAPELYFSRRNDPNNAVARDPADAFSPLELERERRDLRICPNDLAIQVHGGRFTESPSSGQPTDRFGTPTTDCRVSSVVAITDEQLVELYVDRGVVPPLPPMGPGEIEVGEQAEETGEGAESAPR
jgi:hypothetical protein